MCFLLKDLLLIEFRMRIFMESIDALIWEVVVHGRKATGFSKFQQLDSAFLQKYSANSWGRKAEIGTSRKEGILNPMIQIPLNILALVVAKQGTSKQIV